MNDYIFMDTSEHKFNSLLEAGVYNATRSFTGLCSLTVTADYTVVPSGPVENNSCTSDLYYILETKIIGNLHGRCFFIFTSDDYAFMMSRAEETYGLKCEELRRDFAVEVMNIVCSTIMSPLASVFELNVFPDVPHLHIVPGRDYISSTEITGNPDGTGLHFRSVFRSDENITFAPAFFCHINCCKALR